MENLIQTKSFSTLCTKDRADPPTNLTNPPTPTIQEMYDMKNRNYDWESFKYKIPRKYNRVEVKKIHQNSGNVPRRSNYLDQLHRMKKGIPGPNKYKIKQNFRPLSGKLDKSSRETLSAAIVNKCLKENVPGPGYYHRRPQSALTAKTSPTRKDKPLQPKEHYLNEVEYFASETPGVGKYNVACFGHEHVAVYRYPKKTNILKIRKAENKQDDTKSYKNGLQVILDGSFDWTARQKKKKNSNYFGKSERFIVGSKYQKKPGPNSYQINTKWSDDTNVLKTTCSSTSFDYKGSVYYS